MSRHLPLSLLAAAPLWFSATLQAATFTVISTANSGVGSLRQAVLDAEATAASDTIQFAIPGTGPHSITLQSQLLLSQPVVIDGSTQIGSVPNTLTPTQGGLNGQLMIELRGAPGIGNAFFINTISPTASVTLRGLVINRVQTAVLRNTGSFVLEGCYIGTDVLGESVPQPLDVALQMSFAQNVRIGGLLAAQRNLISGASSGLSSGALQLGALEANADVVVQGNLIGTDRLGNAALPNRTGILIGISLIPFGSTGVLIGGNSVDARNVISGNLRAGIAFSCFTTDQSACGNGTQIQGNFIGTSANGLNALGNGVENSSAAISFVQVGEGASRVKIGGAGASEGNRIAFNRSAGVATTSRGILEIVGNQIYANVGLGIDNGSGALGGNDLDDVDTGPNRLQNHPVFVGGQHQGTQIALSYRVNSAAAHSSYPLKVHFYSALGRSGAFYLGEQIYTTPLAEQNGLVQIPAGVVVGFVTATATDAMGNSSQFSLNLDVDGLFANGFE